MKYYPTFGKTLSLSDENYFVIIDRFLGFASLMEVKKYNEVCDLDISKSDEDILKQAEAEYIIRGLNLNEVI